MTSRKDRVRQHFAASMSKQEGSSPTEHHPILGPTRPVLDRAQEIKAKQLEERLSGESEQLRAQIAALREELRAQHEATTAAGIAAATSTRTEILTELTEKVKCTVCLEKYVGPVASQLQRSGFLGADDSGDTTDAWCRDFGRRQRRGRSNVNDPINVDNMPGDGADNPIDVDVEMGGDVEGSVWEGGSGVDSGESESETDGIDDLLLLIFLVMTGC
ncbi:hypothetical protein BJ322DRAFT_1025199 [Thelephora terrestris]|uniref:Uncharacterized protein n=1 Tax=Thelephora terrestris TaxID=56493 RepID=A0A9P6H458_9AGAM|nr:hypothetical protein BJ322DRAFT_1025199 [Thelephora terrestris]